MKRSMIVGLTVVAALCAVTAIAWANNGNTNPVLNDTEPVEAVLDIGVETETAVFQDEPVVPTRPNFVDEDGDGVCDTCGNVPGNGSGQGNQYGNGAQGSNFVDEDGDGVCDTCGNVPGSGQGNRYGNVPSNEQGNWHGNGAMGGNFVDEDGDGVCDICGNAPGSGQGSNFVDEDGDGVCDICGNVPGSGQGNQNHRQDGQGNRHGRGGHGQGGSN
ncbi:hypothetical protein [Candidatus Leptofilum sp.]|uniref:hypothetical protein n=1 Tax=Candidatus Leptofilum sp. TaxID=3241576 RepID=UPI003B5B9330